MTSAADQTNGVLALTHGDPQRARELRDDLAVFARRSDNPTIRRLVAEVLAGRRNVHDVLRTAEFDHAAGAALDKIEQGLAQLTDEQRARVWDRTRPRTPDSVLDSIRDAYDPGGPLVPEPQPEPDSNEHRGPIKANRIDEPTPAPEPPASTPPQPPATPTATPTPARRPRPAMDDEDDQLRETFLKRDW